VENHGAYTFWDSVAPSIEQLNNTSYLEAAVLVTTADFLEQVCLASMQGECTVELRLQFVGDDMEVKAFIEGVQIDI